jgi:RNA polymerase sigma-70 factor (ECF subfamily)
MARAAPAVGERFSAGLLGGNDSVSDRLSKGDPSALDELYAAYGGVLLGAALRLLHDRAEAEEIVQETFLEAWRRAVQYQPERADLVAWLLTIVRSRAIDRLRSKGTDGRTREREATTPWLEPTRPDDLVELRRHVRRVRRELALLPSDQRSLLELAWDEGLSQREIAAKTSIPLGTVKTRMRAALLSLHAGLANLR